jgi:(heptosyl)LPS beta-1,4-glucosyltransferase
MDKLPITAIILTKNEEQMIVNCIETVKWCQEVIVIDSQSTDSTIQLAKRSGAIVYSTDKQSFAERRNYGLSKVRTPWVLYIDADERVTPQLMNEIREAIQDENITALRVGRKNVHYGRLMNHGGWQHDRLERIFRVTELKGWSGKVHESPEYSGQVKELSESLIHLTHRNMVDGLRKTIEWTSDEAELLFRAKHPPVTVTTLIRKSVMEFFRRAILWKGRKDGIEGWIEAMVQGMNKFIVYQRLWELQQKPSLEEKYHNLDKDIIQQWQKRD